MSSQTIKYNCDSLKSMPVSLGRNGELKTRGVAVEVMGKEVWLQPVTSSGSIGRCIIAMPSDPATLREMAAVLLMTAEDVATPEYEEVACA